MRHSSDVRLPPLSTLRAFEASARRGSFSRAAEELHITHGSICRHVAALEALLRRQLFVRHARGVTPTAAARHFEIVVRDALERLAAGLVEARAGIEEPSSRVAVSVLPSFASRWLLPRLATFKKKHPRIDIDLIAGLELADLEHHRPRFDLALRYGIGAWRGVHAKCLMDETLTPVCAPSVHSATDSFESLLARLPLVHDSNEQGWDHWLSRTGHEVPQSAPQSYVFNDYHLVLETAAQGLGIALGRSALIASELAAGRLMEVSLDRVPSLSAYYIVHGTNEPLRQEAVAFCDWLLTPESQGLSAVTNAHSPCE
jgi:LysR family transcriptional regulator, glycine cleavage system transcriptional activator